MDLIDLFFDLRLPTGVVVLDCYKLVPNNQGADWLDRVTSDGRTHRDRLREATADLERIHAGWTPAIEDLSDAPILDDWSLVLLDSPPLLLCGIVAGHHAIRSGRRAITSRLIALDAKSRTWARTVSRFYRLGRMHGTDLSG